MLRLIALILPLALDTFGVSAALGVTGVSHSRGLRIALLFSAFETLMPLIGLAVGVPLARAIGSADLGKLLSLSDANMPRSKAAGKL